MLGLGLFEILIIAAVIFFFLYGGKQLPRIGEDLGKAISNFKKAIKHQP